MCAICRNNKSTPPSLSLYYVTHWDGTRNVPPLYPTSKAGGHCEALHCLFSIPSWVIFSVWKQKASPTNRLGMWEKRRWNSKHFPCSCWNKKRTVSIFRYMYEVTTASCSYISLQLVSLRGKAWTGMCNILWCLKQFPVMMSHLRKQIFKFLRLGV